MQLQAFQTVLKNMTNAIYFCAFNTLDFAAWETVSELDDMHAVARVWIYFAVTNATVAGTCQPYVQTWVKHRRARRHIHCRPYVDCFRSRPTLFCIYIYMMALMFFLSCGPVSLFWYPTAHSLLFVTAVYLVFLDFEQGHKRNCESLGLDVNTSSRQSDLPDVHKVRTKLPYLTINSTSSITGYLLESSTTLNYHMFLPYQYPAHLKSVLYYAHLLIFTIQTLESN